MTLIVLLFLWIRLVEQLRWEWTFNPQYGYGWAVPCLCLYLAFRRIRAADRQSQPAPQPAGTWFLAVAALLYAPIRLVQQANPEWRLVSWTLAFEVIAMTLLLAGQWRAPVKRLLKTRILFPLLFFLLAVPWPTLMEGPVIRWLTGANAAATVEVLNLAAIPAIQHGNLIEVRTGIVAIDPACSGIRSFQAALMLAVFFGEVYSLTALRRVICVMAALALSFGFNLIRTTVLCRVAATKGPAAIAAWHDPAGIAILAACFLCLWYLASANRPHASAGGRGEETAVSNGFLRNIKALRTSWRPIPFKLAAALAGWLLVVEVGAECWYRAHENPRTTAPLSWTVELPKAQPAFQELSLKADARRVLRYDQARSAAWDEGANLKWQAIFLRWNPGRLAAHLAKSHAPEVCLTAAGAQLTRQTGPRQLDIGGLALPFKCYAFTQGASQVHVLYCLAEDRHGSLNTNGATGYRGRLQAVIDGRRNGGQRSLELAVWGIDDDAQADQALLAQARNLIRLQPQPSS